MITLEQWKKYKSYVAEVNDEIGRKNSALIQLRLEQDAKRKWWEWGGIEAPIFQYPLIRPTVEGCLDYLAEQETQ